MKQLILPVSLRAPLCAVFFALCCHCPAAQVVTSSDGFSGYCVATWANGGILTALSLSSLHPRIIVPPDGLPVERIFRGENRKIYACAGGGIYRLDTSTKSLEFVRLGDFSPNVRDACTVGEEYVAAVVGGVRCGEAYRGAELELWKLAPQPACVWKMGAHTLSGVSAGYVAGEPCILVGVVKRTIFDPVVRLRPWLFARAGDGLTARWKGTSFARPHVAAGCAGGGQEYEETEGHGELWAIELTRDGWRELVRYGLNGLVVEATGRSVTGELGDRVVGAKTPDEDCHAFYLWCGGRWGRLIGLVARGRAEDGIETLVIGRCSAAMARPVAWDVAAVDGRPVAVTVDSGGSVSVTPFMECDELNVAVSN